MKRLELQLCLQDAPEFQEQIHASEKDAARIEGVMRVVLKAANNAMDAKRTYFEKQTQFFKGLISCLDVFEDESKEELKLRFEEYQQEQQKEQELKKQSMEQIIQCLEFFCDSKRKDLRKKYENSSEQMENALEKYLSRKPTEPELARIVTEARQLFHESSLSYCFYLNQLQIERNAKILKMFPKIDRLEEIDLKTKGEMEEMEKQKEVMLKHKHLYNPMHRGLIDNVSNQTSKQGYLFRKQMIGWQRKYFLIENNNLVCPKQKEQMDLTISTVKLEQERRYCFNVFSAQKSWILQAENEEDMHSWMQNIQQAVCNVQESRELKDHKQFVYQIRQLEGNKECVDCTQVDPEWANINYGTLLCIECSGIHRSLGVQVSKVRSLLLDRWDMEAISLMHSLGNKVVNQILKDRIDANSQQKQRQEFIEQKYIQKQNMTPYQGTNINEDFFEAISQNNVSHALFFMLNGAHINFRDPDTMQCAIHKSIESNFDATTELLLNWNADLNEQDGFGRTPLHYCAFLNNIRVMFKLLKRNVQIKYDQDGNTPLDVALLKTNVQAVTVLRLHMFKATQSQMNEVITELEP